MRINHNIPAMNAHRLLNANNSTSAKALERLSSGKRINRAGDDAAGMAITEKMRAQVNGLKMASRNSLDGVSLVQTAEGAMGEIHSMLQRMRELSVQAANGTMSPSDRQAVQDEINQLTSEVNRIANGTEYNTRNILKGNEGPDSNTLVHRMSTGKPAQYTGDANVGGMTPPAFNLAGEQLSIWVDGEERVVNLTQTDTNTTKDNFMDLVNDALGNSAKAVLDKNGNIELTTASIGGSSKIEIKGSQAAVRLFKTGWSAPTAYPSKAGTAESATSKSTGTFYFDGVPEVGSTIKIGNETIEFFDSSISPYVGSNRPIDIKGKTSAEAIVEEIVTKFSTGIEGVTLSEDSVFDTGASGTAKNARLIVEAKNPGFDGNLIYLEGTPDDFTTTLQVGANTGQEFRLQIGDIRAKNLKISADNPTRNPGVKGASFVKSATVTDGVSSSMTEYAVDVSDEAKASAAIKVFDNAIVQVASERSKLGATQNRLEHTIANLDNTHENLTAAMSRIEDADMALEMAEFQKLNVLQQAGTSMLAQANQQPQSILKLLNA